MYLVSKYGTKQVEIDKLQDLFWHLHILDTRQYIEDCKNIFGYYLHHNPFTELKKTPKISWKHEDIHKTTYLKA